MLKAEVELGSVVEEQISADIEAVKGTHISKGENGGVLREKTMQMKTVKKATFSDNRASLSGHVSTRRTRRHEGSVPASQFPSS